MRPETERAIQRMDYMRNGPHPLTVLGGVFLLLTAFVIGLLIVLNAIIPGGIARRVTPVTQHHRHVRLIQSIGEQQ